MYKHVGKKLRNLCIYIVIISIEFRSYKLFFHKFTCLFLPSKAVVLNFVLLCFFVCLTNTNKIQHSSTGHVPIGGHYKLDYDGLCSSHEEQIQNL
jgi:hypothetical protein